ALLSYFMGDFEWAQEQFDILKSATTKLISNDAIDKSVFILDNLGLDTTAVPLQLYATSELLVFQNKYEEAFQTLDSIEINFPEHGLEDDVLYLKAQIYKRERQYDKAIEQYQVILDKFKEEIRADNALFEMAELYENVLEDKEKAKSLYEQLFLEFDNSTFAVEARKRFRILRGDEI
ncbi:MAG TPA: tetratricopeptide repeat protein, partial [Saprospiraceae bacterium]|nr:tetratricopeptide repeat protein [Saprospiraceae bacterium]